MYTEDLEEKFMDIIADVHVENMDNNLMKFDEIQKQLDELSRLANEDKPEIKEKTIEEMMAEANDATMKELIEEELN
jgi:prephenate dehydrogenase